MGYTKSHALKTAIHETVNRIKISATKRNNSSQSETALTSKVRQISHQQKRCTAGKFQPSLRYTLMYITIQYFSLFTYIQFLFLSKHDLSLSHLLQKKRTAFYTQIKPLFPNLRIAYLCHKDCIINHH